MLPHYLCDREDWPYMSVSPVLGQEYRQVSEDLYEQVIVRKPELHLYQGVFGTFPHLTEWPMKDLYSKHPTKENIWLYRGRADDVIVFSTGESCKCDVFMSRPLLLHARGPAGFMLVDLQASREAPCIPRAFVKFWQKPALT